MEGMQRPEPTVLPESAVIPDGSLIRPPPTAFTHELTVEQPFRYVGSDPSSPADGVLPVGTRVVLMDDGGDVCRVVDGRGLYVATGCAGLRRLPADGRLPNSTR